MTSSVNGAARCAWSKCKFNEISGSPYAQRSGVGMDSERDNDCPSNDSNKRSSWEVGRA